MRPGDTSLGGVAGGFPETTWSCVSRLGASGTAERNRAMEKLCRLYWKPIYRFLRIARARSNEDAKDLTQAFLLWAMEGDALQRYAPEQGSFRNYLKVLLGRFVWHQDEALHRLKRGGGVRLVSLDDPSLAADDAQPDAHAARPEEAFDRAWVSEIARLALEKVRERFEREGKSLAIRAYDEYERGASGQGVTYAAVGSQLGLGENEVRKILFQVREALRTELRAQIADLTRNPEELESEWNELLGA